MADGVYHAWKAGPQTVALRRAIEDMRDGGVFAMFIPKAPYRCPPGPYERACVVASYLKTAKPRSKVLVLDANPEIMSKKGLFTKAFNELYGGIIEYKANAELKELAGGVARTEFDDVKADVINAIPPQRAGDLARSAGLLNMNARWAGVNWLTMESTAAPGIHVLGDATFSAPLMPKSGHMANQQAKVDHLQVWPAHGAGSACGKALGAVPQSTLGYEKRFNAAILAAARNQVEARLALGWADNIWADSLALA